MCHELEQHIYGYLLCAPTDTHSCLLKVITNLAASGASAAADSTVFLKLSNFVQKIILTMQAQWGVDYSMQHSYMSH